MTAQRHALSEKNGELQGQSGPSRTGHVQAVHNATRVLQTLAQTRGAGRGLTDLTRALRISKASLLRILLTLEDDGLIRKDPDTDRYLPAMRLFELGCSALDTLDVHRLAHPYLEELAASTAETVHLCVLEQGQVVYIDKMESPQTVRLYSSIGRRAPVHCTGVGKAMIAFLPARDRRHLIELHPLKKYTEHTITDFLNLERELERIREHGVAYDREEHETGIVCAAAAIFDYTGRPQAAISVTAPTFRTDTPRMRSIAAQVKQTAGLVSEIMGYAGGD